jgi:hypothetical protein
MKPTKNGAFTPFFRVLAGSRKAKLQLFVAVPPSRTPLRRSFAASPKQPLGLSWITGMTQVRLEKAPFFSPAHEKANFLSHGGTPSYPF